MTVPDKATLDLAFVMAFQLASVGHTNALSEALHVILATAVHAPEWATAVIKDDLERLLPLVEQVVHALPIERSE